MIPRRTQQMTWGQEVPQGLKEEVEISKNKLYGNWIKGLEPEYYRMCWYVVFLPAFCPNFALQGLLTIVQGCSNS